MTTISYTQGDFGFLYDVFVVGDEDRSILIQTDWDYPGLASTFGWQPCHDSTDGTIDCPVCGKSASEMIGEAQDYLDAHQGEEVEDPGYFD